MQKRFGIRFLALVLTLAIFTGCIPAQDTPDIPQNQSEEQKELNSLPKGAESVSLAHPEYPSFLSYKDFEGEQERREELSETLLACISDFCGATASKLMPAEQENALYSPLSLYFALSMLAESAGGETRQQALDLLGTDLESLRAELAPIWRSLYCDNEYCKRQAANSLWLPLEDGFEAKREFLDTLSSDYYAEIYKTQFGTEQSALDISNWIAEHTGAKLGGNPADFTTAPFPDTAMILYSTLYYKDEWVDRFDKAKTAPDTFHTASGETVTCDFMNRTYGSHGMEYGQNYSSLQVQLKEGSIQFVLPNEDVTPYDILGDANRMKQIISHTDEVESIYGEVIFSLPKFDYKDTIDLSESLQELGLTDAFDPETADFSPVSDQLPLFISKARQEATIAIDENGVEAAAFTELAYAGAGMPTSSGKMILDRPFLYIIYGRNSLPMFIGVVNDPTA